MQAIGDRLDALAASAPAITTDVLDRLPALEARLQALPGEVDDQVAHVVATLALPIALPPQFPGPDPIIPIEAEIVAAIDGAISPIVGWLQDIAAKLDVTAIEEPVETAAAAATAAVDGVEQAIAGVTTQTQQLFGEAERLLDALDIAAVVGGVEDALEGFGSAVTGQLTALFAPVRTVLDGALGTLDGAIGGFDPAQITALLENVAADLKAVLEAAPVVAARDAIGTAVTAAESAMASLSFRPVTDGIVDTLDGITEVLDAIPAPVVPPPLQQALAAAAAALPQDLEPLTDPLLAELRKAVDNGPGALAASRAPRGAAADQVRAMEPAALVGNALTAPFAEAVSTLESFTPSRLLEPVDTELARSRSACAPSRPARLLAPLQEPFGELLGAFDQLEPESS